MLVDNRFAEPLGKRLGEVKVSEVWMLSYFGKKAETRKDPERRRQFLGPLPSFAIKGQHQRPNFLKHPRIP